MDVKALILLFALTGCTPVKLDFMCIAKGPLLECADYETWNKYFKDKEANDTAKATKGEEL